MRITASEAEAFFAHPSQRKAAMLDGPLPDWMEYRAEAHVCLGFHPAPWPDVWMVHIGVKPEGWGHLTDRTKRLLQDFWDEQQPTRIVAWMKDSNRAAIALARRVGFETDGAFPGVIMMGWQRCP
jgi:RimJ/RimL family protein N-acetyltransferase